MVKDASELVTPAATSGFGVGTGYVILRTAQSQATLINDLLNSVLVLSVFAIGCFFLAWGIGQWLHQNKENRKWSAGVSYGASTLAHGVFPVLVGNVMLNNAQSSGLAFDLQALSNQYVSWMGFFGVIFLIIGALVIRNYVK